MSTAALTALTAEVKSLKAEMISLREAVMASATPTKASAKAKKAATAKDPDAPKREATWWIKATQHVREVLKAQIEADNASLVAEGGKKQAGTVPVRVASMLKAAGKLSDEAMPEDDEIFEAYEEFKMNPPEPKMPALREAAAAKKAGSVSSSTGSKASSKPKFAELSEEEQTAARKARAIKAAATRAANKAAKEASAEEEASASEAEAPAPKAKVIAKKAAAPAPVAAPVAVAAPAPVAAAVPVDAEEADESEAEEAEEATIVVPEATAEVALEAYEWKGNIGKGMKTYERIDHGGKAYIYTAESVYIGVFDEKAKKLDKSAKDILA